jgi:hypothetical protein
LLKIELDLEKEKNISNSEYRSLHQIKKDASNMDPKAVFLLDQINNYNKIVIRRHNFLKRQRFLQKKKKT